MKFLPLGSTFNALLGGLRLPAHANDFFSPALLAASRESGKQSGRLENVILLTERGQKHTLLTHSGPLAAFHFPTAEFPGREKEREGETEWPSVASKAKRPLSSILLYLLPKPIHLGMPSRSPSRLLR